jgi:hypothetical protein
MPSIFQIHSEDFTKSETRCRIGSNRNLGHDIRGVEVPNIYILSFLILLLFGFYLVFYFRLKIHNKRKKIKLLIFNNRLHKIYSFELISENILDDILDAIKDLQCSYEQVHAILPLLSDIRKHGDKLIEKRKFYHSILFPDSEQRLSNKIIRLHQAENFIKSLSKQEQEGRQCPFPAILKKAGTK